MPLPVWRCPPIGDKYQHLCEHGQGRRRVSAEVSVAVQCMVGAGSAAKRAVPRLLSPKSLDVAEMAILQGPFRGGNPMCY